MSGNQIIAVCLADTHLKESNIKENWQVYRQTVEFCKERKIDTIIHLSDILDSRKSQTEKVLNTFHEILEYLEQEKILMISFPGNHDKVAYGQYSSFLRPFKKHPSFSFHEEYYFFPLTTKLVFHFIPFFSDNIYQIELEKSREVIKKCLDFDSDAQHILFTHIGVSGARMNSGTIVDGIKPSELSHFDKVYVGHYHDKQFLGEKIVYVGASLQHGFSEQRDKGITLIFDDLSIETIPLDTKEYVKQELKVDELSSQDVQDIIDIVKNTPNKEIKIILVGSEEKVKSFNKQQLMIEGIAVETKVDRIEKEEIENRVEPFTPLILNEQFEVFCKKNELDLIKGKEYLQKASL